MNIYFIYSNSAPSVDCDKLRLFFRRDLSLTPQQTAPLMVHNHLFLLTPLLNAA